MELQVEMYKRGVWGLIWPVLGFCLILWVASLLRKTLKKRGSNRKMPHL